jgi:hypothetical protein
MDDRLNIRLRPNPIPVPLIPGRLGNLPLLQPFFERKSADPEQLGHFA